MRYKVSIDSDFVFVYLDSRCVGKFDVDTFLTSVISPLEFRKFENNPDKNIFEIRKLEFNNHNLKP